MKTKEDGGKAKSNQETTTNKDKELTPGSPEQSEDNTTLGPGNQSETRDEYDEYNPW